MNRRADSTPNQTLGSTLRGGGASALDCQWVSFVGMVRYGLSMLLVFPFISACDPGVEIVRPPVADFTINPMVPKAYKPGGVVSIKGAGFSEAIALSIKNLKYPLEFVSPNEVLFKIPETPGLALAGESGVGKIPMEMSRLGISKEVHGVYLAAASDYPLITEAASEVCAGKKFYNASGELNEGTKHCSTGNAPPIAACSRDGEVGCVTTSTYKAADITNLSAGNIKTGIVIAGTMGSYPSANFPLKDADSTADLDFASFNAKIKSAANFEWFDSSGTRHVNAGDTDITIANIAKDVTIFGATGNLGAGPCTGDGQTGCTTTTQYKSVDTSALSAWDLRKGKSAGGITGSLVFYKNMANTTLFDRVAGTASSTGLDIYDTIDDYNNTGAFPTENPGGWDQATGANWTQEVAGTVYKDNITGLVWLKELGVSTWETAIAACDGATSGSRSDWRLPTQKELMQAYTDGIWSQKTNLSLQVAFYWSASSVSNAMTGAWYVNPVNGTTSNIDKTGTLRIVCVAP